MSNPNLDPSQLLFPDPQAPNYSNPMQNTQPIRRLNAASPFSSGPVAAVSQVRPAVGFNAPTGTAPYRPQSSSQLNTPLGQKQTIETPTQNIPEVAGYPPSQFHTHQFDTATLDGSNTHPFQTTNLNSTTGSDIFNLPNSGIPHPIQQTPDYSLPMSSSTFNAPPPAPAQLTSYSSNFDSVESGTSDPFSTSDPGAFSRPPPLPTTRRDSFNNPFETAPQADPFRQSHYLSPGAPPPPAAPFLNYNTTPTQQQQYSSIPSPTVFNQGAPTPSPKVLQRPPPSPQRQISRDITTIPRTVDDLFQEFMSNVSPDNLPTPIPNIHELQNTLEALKILYSQQQWLQLEAKAWSMLGSPDPQFNLQVHSWAMVSLMKQGKIDELEQQVIVIGDLDHPQYQYETYPERFPSQCGSFVPMRLRFMTIQLPRLKNNISMYETMASQFLIDLEKNSFKLEEKTASTWYQIIATNLINSFVERKKFDLAIRLAKKLHESQKDQATVRQQVLMACRLGRIYLQMGDLNQAEVLFAEASDLNQQIESPNEDCAARLMLNQGLLYFANNKFKEALDAFNTILGVYSSEVPVDLTEILDEPFASWDDGDVVSCAANNMSICALYSCEVQTAVNVLETILQSDPRRHLHSAVVFNLSTLYDLVCDNANSTNRKEMIKRVSEAYGIEHIEATCFRI